MKDYYSLFVELSLQQCTKIDYADELKVKAHNKASKKLGQLQKEMKQIDCKEILYNLLNHPDDRVKVNAVFVALLHGNPQRSTRAIRPQDQPRALPLLLQHIVDHRLPGRSGGRPVLFFHLFKQRTVEIDGDNLVSHRLLISFRCFR